MNEHVVTTVGDNDINCGWELKGSIVKEDRAINRGCCNHWIRSLRDHLRCTHRESALCCSLSNEYPVTHIEVLGEAV